VTFRLRYSLDQNPPCHSDERWVGVTRGDVELPKWESRMADKEREPLLSMVTTVRKVLRYVWYKTRKKNLTRHDWG